MVAGEVRVPAMRAAGACGLAGLLAEVLAWTFMAVRSR
jgi:hypothetical protein